MKNILVTYRTTSRTRLRAVTPVHRAPSGTAWHARNGTELRHGSGDVAEAWVIGDVVEDMMLGPSYALRDVAARVTRSFA
jgi:hypothetical protein